MAEGFKFRSSLVVGKNNVATFERAYEGLIEQIREQLGTTLNDYSYKLIEILDMNFENEQNKAGEEWAQLAPSTVRKRERLGFSGEHPILQRTQRLKEAVFKAITVQMVGSGAGSELSFKVNIAPDPSALNDHGVPYIDIANWLNRGFTHAVKLSALKGTLNANMLQPETSRSTQQSDKQEAQVPGRQFMYITLEQKKYFLSLVRGEMDDRLRKLNPKTYKD